MNSLLEKEKLRKQEGILFSSFNSNEEKELEIASLSGEIMAFLTLYNVFGKENPIKYLRTHENKLKTYISELGSAISWYKSNHYRETYYKYHKDQLEELIELEETLMKI